MSEPDPSEARRQLALAKRGNQEALAWLIESTQARLFRFCFYLAGDRQLAQDLCQDVYVRVLENVGKIQDGGAFGAWLFRAANNLFLDHVKAPRNKPHTPLEEVGSAQLASPVAGSEELLDVRRALGAVEPEERALLLLVDLEGHSYVEAAEIIGISESAVRSRLHRARKAFSEIFKKS